LNWKNKIKTVFPLLREKNGLKNFLIIYLIAILFSFVIDTIYGRTIANLWHYPHSPIHMSLLLPVFVYYPFGGFQIYEIFYFLKNKLSKRFKNNSYYTIPKIVKSILSYLLIVSLILGGALPILNFFLNENRGANELIVIFMILTAFSSDMIMYKLNKKSILFSLLGGNKLILTTMILSWIISALLTEYPNTCSWEWIYTMPFTSFEILKINILILTFGWFFLVYVSVRSIDLIFYFLKYRKAGL